MLALPWRVGLRIPASAKNLLEEVKPIIDDCATYGSVILGIEITEAYSKSFIADVKTPGPIHVVQAVKCDVSDPAKQLVQSHQRMYTSDFLQGLENDPTIFLPSSVLSP